MKREVRAKLAKVYFELAVLPGMDARLVEIAANMTMSLIEHKKRIDISDLQLPWRPIYQLLEKELCKPITVGGPALPSGVQSLTHRFPSPRARSQSQSSARRA